jgi:uncharacterized protein YndB with AHSA1/START domain
MATSTTSILIKASRSAVYRAVADVQALARCLAPEGTSSRILGYDPISRRLRMEITHAPGPEGTRRFHLERLEARQDEAVVYGTAFETGDPQLAGDMKLHFTLEDAPGGTLVTVRHEGIPASISLADNEAGTQSSLRNLAQMVERNDGA